jgi:hypothetical protein
MRGNKSSDITNNSDDTSQISELVITEPFDVTTEDEGSQDSQSVCTSHLTFALCCTVCLGAVAVGATYFFISLLGDN